MFELRAQSFEQSTNESGTRQVHASEENARKAHSFAQNANEWGTPAGREEKKIWEKRFYDFNVWSAQKQIEKVKYMHRNPVKRGLVEQPEQWPWSSFRAYLYGETGPVRVRFQEWGLEIKPRPAQSFVRVESPVVRTEQK